MPWMKWLPWRFFLQRAARAHGFLDPIALLARVRAFAQPAEVGEPVELLRAGMIFHARGLINARVIQHNLDWVWPYWIEQQFDPASESFIPRAFSMTHCNLSHRNWTAIGVPDVPQLAIVDPRGLLTPHFDGWSLDAWVLPDQGPGLFPSRNPDSHQELVMNREFAVVTRSHSQGCSLASQASVYLRNGEPDCQLQLAARSDSGGWLAIALRPCNPEGVSFIHRIAMDAEHRQWTVDHQAVRLDQPADRVFFSDYHSGDVGAHLRQSAHLQQNPSPEGSPNPTSLQVECGVGMATAAALYRLQPGSERRVTVSAILENKDDPTGDSGAGTSSPPAQWTAPWGCRLQIPDPGFQFLYDAAVRTLVLHSPTDVYPGPYTYKRFWFRDAAFMIYALLCAGLTDRAERALDRFGSRQTRSGFFHSQEGEWDSNGEALWIFSEFEQMSGRPLKDDWLKAVIKGGRWIMAKRTRSDTDSSSAGLLPAGFSAEHLGPPDCYYWDDFWGIAGLRAAARLCQPNDGNLATTFSTAADDFQHCVDRSLSQATKKAGRAAMPASPHRRLDHGAIGSLAAGYPLRLYDPGHPALLDTAEFLLQSCFFRGGFFQDIIHSGINPYLTLHVAQVLLRAGDRRHLELMRTIASLASETGQWPEAIHPRTGGGCMGDGQHAWAAAEWLLMLRNCLVREEAEGLILGSGIAPEWLQATDQSPAEAAAVEFGPAPTRFGPVTLKIYPVDPVSGRVRVDWSGHWHRHRPSIEIRLPGFIPAAVDDDQGHIHLQRDTLL